MAVTTIEATKPLRTASIVDLREANSREIGRLDAALEEASFPEGTDRETVVAELSARLAQRIELETAVSTTAQRQAYGYARWESSFVRMQEVRVPEGCRLTEDQLRQALWRAVPPSNFRRFQELFCDPHNLVVPRFRIEHGTRVVFLDNPDFSEMSVAGCLVSPDRIPDDFCKGVLQIKFSVKELEDPRARLLRKAEIDVIGSLKRLWDSADVVSTRETRSFRVLLIHRPSAETEAYYSYAAPFPVGLHGTLLVTRGDTSDRIVKKNPLLGPEQVRPLRIAHFKTIYDAHRRALHVACGYRRESEDLVTLQSRVKMGLERIGTEVRREAEQGVKDSVRAEVSDTIDLGKETLEGSIAAGKRYAAEFFKKVQGCRDKSGRINWAVVVNRMRSAEGLIGSRVGEITVKGGHIQIDEKHLRAILDREYTILKTFADTLAANADALLVRQRKPGLVSRPAEIRSVSAAVALSRLVPNRRSLETVACRPLSTFAGLLRVGCQDLESALQRKDYRQIEESTVKLHIVSKLFKANDHLQTIKALLIDPDYVPFDEVKREVDSIRTALSRKIVRGVIVRGWEEKFKALEERITELTRKLAANPKASAAPGSREQYFTELRELVDSIRPEATAWALVPAKWRNGSSGSAPPPGPR